MHRVINKNIKLNKRLFNLKNMLRITLITLVLVLVTAIAIITVSAGPDQKKSYTVSMTGKDVSLNVGEKYKDAGIKLVVSGVDKTAEVVIKSNVNTKKIGTYYVTYYWKNKLIKKRKVKIKDAIAPEIVFAGAEAVSIIQTSDYVDAGFSGLDNYDGDITSKVVITNNIDKSKVGQYEVVYTVIDSSGNQTVKKRIVNVVAKPKTIIKKVVATSVSKDVLPPPPPVVAGKVNAMKFNASGITIAGCVDGDDQPLNILLNGVSYELSASGNCYSASLNFSDLSDGNYDYYLKSNKGTNKIINQMDPIYQIKRAKVGDKLVTFNYVNSNIQMTVGDYYYDYDILIDVGHGGSDTGAINNFIYERDLNLEVSEYEKARYESMGLKVKLSRTDNASYGLMMGDASWVAVRRRAYAVGYYGATSRYVYSNHHNATASSSTNGFEMLIPATQSNITIEKNISNSLMDILKYKTIRMYTKNYDTNGYFEKSGGQTYTFTNWYAINRIPYELFNTYATIYEGCYMSNVDEFLWYYNSQNWKSVSEAKIKAYVQATGRTYVSP